MQSINRNKRALPENKDDYLHPLDPVIVAVTTALFIASPRNNSYWNTTEVSKMACLTSIITTNITTKILSEIDQEIGELKTMVLSYRAAIDYLLLQHSLDCQQFSDVYCFTVSHFPILLIDKLMICIKR